MSIDPIIHDLIRARQETASLRVVNVYLIQALLRFLEKQNVASRDQTLEFLRDTAQGVESAEEIQRAIATLVQCFEHDVRKPDQRPALHVIEGGLADKAPSQ